MRLVGIVEKEYRNKKKRLEMAMWHFRLFFLLFSLPRGNAVHLHLQRAAWAVPLRCILHRSTLHRFRQKTREDELPAVVCSSSLL